MLDAPLFTDSAPHTTSWHVITCLLEIADLHGQAGTKPIVELEPTFNHLPEKMRAAAVAMVKGEAVEGDFSEDDLRPEDVHGHYEVTFRYPYNSQETHLTLDSNHHLSAEQDAIIFNALWWWAVSRGWEVKVTSGKRDKEGNILTQIDVKAEGIASASNMSEKTTVESLSYSLAPQYAASLRRYLENLKFSLE
jgi:hypothetical protein